MGGVISMTYFWLDETPSGKYIIRPVYEKFPIHHFRGSYAVMPSRFLGLSYANYLRLCRDAGGAEIVGKNHKYPVAYFNNDTKAQEFVKRLNQYTAYLLNKKS
jgi:hypothetical protein